MIKKQTVYKIVNPITENTNTGLIVKYVHNGIKFPVSKVEGYFFTPEELEQLLSDSFAEGHARFTECGEFELEHKANEYIQNLLNKEK
jgi:hypothetical protein